MVRFQYNNPSRQLTAPRVDDIANEDALLVQYLEKAGAVFHVRTNQPQSLMVSNLVHLRGPHTQPILAYLLRQQSHRSHNEPLQPHPHARRLLRGRGRLNGLQVCCSRRRHRHWRVHPSTRRLLRCIWVSSHDSPYTCVRNQSPRPRTGVHPRHCRTSGKPGCRRSGSLPKSHPRPGAMGDRNIPCPVTLEARKSHQRHDGWHHVG
jgi:hypothetical protein